MGYLKQCPVFSSYFSLSQGIYSLPKTPSPVNRTSSIRQRLKSLFLTGDVDTVAAIALGVASCSEEVTQDLPSHLFEGLENGRYGRDYIRELDKKLLNRVFLNGFFHKFF